MDNYVITIARQYGSGGRTVGEMLSKNLGIAYYDKDIIRLASDDSGIHEELFGRVDEYTSAKRPLFDGRSGIYSNEMCCRMLYSRACHMAGASGHSFPRPFTGAAPQ